MTTWHPTVDELVAALCRSELPTVIVEGEDDMRIYRWVEARVSNQKAYVQPAGGSKTLLSVYKRRNEFAHLPVVFVADKDLWLFSGIPPDYSDIIWTKGYSIENDLYAGADLERLLEAEEAEEHRQVLDSIIEWFAFEVEVHLAGGDAQVNTHCNRVVPLGEIEMDEDFRNNRRFRPPNQKLHQQIKTEYQLQLRGKSLFQILVRFLSASDRDVKHRTSGLYEIAFKMTPTHELMDRLINVIECTIENHTPPN